MKQMPLTDVGLLKKAMGLTFSVHDGEALAALRKANAVLRRNGLSWEEVLGRTVTVQAGSDNSPVENGEELTLKEQIQRAFNEIRGTIKTDFNHFIEDIEKDFERTGYLSPAQRQPLFEAVRRHRQERRRDE